MYLSWWRFFWSRQQCDG